MQHFNLVIKSCIKKNNKLVNLSFSKIVRRFEQ